jgi:hypothetical protein
MAKQQKHTRQGVIKSKQPKMKTARTDTGSALNQAWTYKEHKEVFTGDELIDAWRLGCAKGLEIKRKEIEDTLKQNILKAQRIGEVFFCELNNDKHRCISIMMRILDIDSFELKCILIADSYYDANDVRPLYKKAFELEREYENDNFHVVISFIEATGKLNFDRLFSDGFLIKYGELQ